MSGDVSDDSGDDVRGTGVALGCLPNGPAVPQIAAGEVAAKEVAVATE